MGREDRVKQKRILDNDSGRQVRGQAPRPAPGESSRQPIVTSGSRITIIVDERQIMRIKATREKADAFPLVSRKVHYGDNSTAVLRLLS
jgi:hypothetical protein